MPITDGVAVDIAGFKALMSTFPSGVAIVTTVDGDGRPLGLTCSSLCSVSLDPPLLLVCIRNGSSTLPAIAESAILAVNFLHRGGREAAEVFASGAKDRFGRIPWRSSESFSLPCLTAHAHAVAECIVRHTVVLGDHTVVVAQVARIGTVRDAVPLLYGMRRYAEWPHRGRLLEVHPWVEHAVRSA
jgi:flavin reductase (DIM6/NTAB) family NADH-FMN oxidoreductase RutF